jgi:UDP-N-acetylmuramate--alanine ligase
VAAILAEANLDPTFIIGGRLKGADSNARLGASDYLVAEADESDASFHHLQPLVAVVTNIDADHLGTYGNDIGRLRHAFLEFLHNLPFYGLAVVCTDDPGVRAVLPELARSTKTYGLEAGADVRATDISFERDSSRFTVRREGREPLAVTLGLPGEHNVRNALAAIAVATDFDVPDAAIQSALAGFGGIDRRFQALGPITVRGGEATLVDDYGHHPTEIAATIAAARRGWPDRRLALVFQPHRYTRTHELLDDFATVLSEVDVLVLLDVYAAGEAPIAGADGRALARAVRQRGAVEPVFVDDAAALPETLARLLEDRDLVLTMGAGDVGAIARSLPGALAALAADDTEAVT